METVIVNGVCFAYQRDGSLIEIFDAAGCVVADIVTSTASEQMYGTGYDEGDETPFDIPYFEFCEKSDSELVEWAVASQLC